MDPKPGQIGLDDNVKPPVPVGLVGDPAELNDWSPAGKRATSIKAFVALMESGRRQTAAMKVYNAVVMMGQTGLTAERVERVTRMKTQTVTARLWDLSRAGLVYRAGDTRPTDSGGTAYVYRVTAEAWPASGSLTARRATTSGKRTQPAKAADTGSNAAVSEAARRVVQEINLACDPVRLSPMATSPTVAGMLRKMTDITAWLGELA